MDAEEFIPTRESVLHRLRDWDDEKSWRDFFETHWKIIYGVARKAGLSDAEAQDAAVGSDLTLTVNATGTGPLQYQWRRNGENIPGATNATYTLTNAQITDGGNYTVVVANEVGIVVSSPILVIIEVAQQPAGDDFANRTLVTGVTNAVGGIHHERRHGRSVRAIDSGTVRPQEPAGAAALYS